MKRPIIMRFIQFTACVLFMSMSAFAHVSPPVLQILDGSRNQISKDSTTTVQDSIFFDPTYNTKLIKPYPVLNWITFRINETSTKYLQSAFTATVRLHIATTQANLTVTTVDTSLTINYRSDSIYTNRSTYTFRNGYKVQITVLSVSTNVAWNVWQSLTVEDGLQSMPAFNFSCSNDAIQTISHTNLPANTVADELPVSWGNVASADFYDLEWTYVDSSALALGRYGTPSTPDPNLIFDNSQTRVTITGTSYNIPLLYDGSGTLFFRVRSVQQQASWGRSESNWSSTFANGMGSFVFNGHQRNMNWQSTTSFAEDGKRKTIVQYYDGSLRNRQTVTKDNSTNTVIVAENFYDYQGRAAIQVLPAPTLNNIIGYSKNFNIGLNGAYDKGNFDTLLSPSTYCSSGADSMKSDSGSARYYSPKNPEKNIAFNQFIPDAKGYPFTQVVYTQDNTNRISKQSGVGPMYRIGSGHENMYFYGTPDQRELDAVFGTEVGDHSHYFKTMVRDANGQYSLSYTDMHGRTIGTALAGTPPDSIKLDKLSSNVTTVLTESLVDSTSNVTKNLVMESKRGLLVSLAGTYTFTYSLNPQSLTKAGCNSVNVCYDCLYDLEITITDDCNNQKLGGQPYDTIVHNFSMSAIDTTCSNAAGTFSFTFSKFLQEGSYDITKKLSVSTYGMNYYRDSVFVKKNTCKTVDSFIHVQQLAQAAITQCQPSCQSCKDSLGTWTTFQQKFMKGAGIATADSAGYRALAMSAYLQAQADCRALCDTVSDFEDIQSEMLLDMTPPSGQYANLDSAQDIYSIFYTVYGSDSNVVSAPPYTRATGYVDGNGNLDSVYDEVTGSFVLPQKLSPDAFVQKFKLSWAQALLPFHPEYCKLNQYLRLLNSSRWDHRFESTDTYQQALQKGYLNPTGGTTFPFTKYNGTVGQIDQDPIDTCSWHDFKSQLAAQLSVYTASGNNGTSNHPSSMWAYASAMVVCGQANLSCFTGKTNDDSAFNTHMCAGDLDMAWRNFRQLYLDVKHKLINDQLIALCPQPPNPLTKTLVTANHQPHFSDAADMLNAIGSTIPSTIADTVTAKQQGQSATDSFYYNNCKIYATNWWQQLKPCSYTSGDSAAIIPQLIMVCKEGSDASHPFGASSVRPASTYKYRSFRDVLQHFSDSSFKTFNATTGCNAYLITDPPPYDKQRPYSDLTIWSKPDSCQCSVITNLYTAYQQNNLGYGSFSAYVNALNKTQMSETDLQTLRGLCNNTNPTCTFLQTPVIIPSALQCGSEKACATCTQIAQIYSQFLSDYPQAIILPGTDSASQQDYINLFTNYFNAKLGYKKQFNDYINFIQQCGIPYLQPSTTANQLPGPLVSTPVTGNASTSGVRCDTLQNIVAQFNTLYPTLARFNHASVQRKRSFNPSIEYLLSCTGITKPYPPANVVNPPKWIGSGMRDSGYTSLWHRNNLTFVKFDFSSFGGLAILDSINLKLSPVLTDPFDTLVYWCNMATKWDTTLTCGQLGVSYNGYKISSFNPLYKYNTALGHPIYTYDCGVQFSLNVPYSNANLGNVLTSFMNPATSAGNNESFVGSSNPLAQSDPETRPHMEIYYRVDSIYSCKDLIAAYFNYRLNTNISYDSLASLYHSKCGSNFPITCTFSADTLSLCGRSEAVFPKVTLPAVTNCSDSTFFSVSKGTEQYKSYSDSLNNNFDSSYRAVCLQAYKFESFTVTHNINVYHITLYYYDQAGNLVKTIPPAGVHPNISVGWLDSVKVARAAGQVKIPAHTLPSQYRYNSLNRLIAQRTPDMAQTLLWYDRLGRLAISQNTKQKSVSGTENNRLYTYTLYDQIGRVTETGEIKNATTKAMADSISRSQNSLNTWIANSAVNKSQITQTVYDVAYAGFTGNPIGQRNLRNRVAYATYSLGNNPAQYNQGTFYTYDAHGNVDSVLQDYGSNTVTATQNVMNSNGNRFKKIAYKYDLISGKVNHVAYQANQADQFYHRFSYDAENRLTLAETSSDSITWEKEARYQYYKHGPLARKVIGDQLVQGNDYAYTLQGWLKGVNATALNSSFDMGNDGLAAGTNQYVAKDALAFNLNYYSGDYSPINTTAVPFPGTSAFLGTNYKPLYNSNISSIAMNIGKFNNPLLYNYTYDQLNRITGMDVFNGFNQTTNSWSAIVSIQDYKERAAYDENGNLTNYLRNGFGSLLTMDSLTYRYNLDAQGQLLNNRLDHFRDRVNGSTSHSGNYTVDIEDQLAGNYLYDSVGNLTKDVQENITSISWNVFRKITEIQRTATTANPVTDIQYTYDAAGNRVSKRVLLNTGSVTYTSYVRDASGKVLAVYTSTGTGSTYSSYSLNLNEQHIYGTNRLAIQSRNVNMKTAFTPGAVINTVRGYKYYELANHLGNVMVTITDKKLGVSSNNTTVDYYTADVSTANDYYPFGMLMPNRTFAAATGTYRYGYNDKERDNEVKGSGNQIDYGARIYDPRAGRFLSVDPLYKNYPEFSPYQYASNNAIATTDLDGKEFDWLTWKIALWASGASLGNSNSDNNLVQHVRDYESASTNNYGRFDQTGAHGTYADQVDENAKKALVAKLSIYADVSKGVAVGGAVVATPFIIAPAVAVLPELFAAGGVSSYLIKSTVEATIDASTQKLVNGKVDWADVLSNYLPVKGVLGKTLLTAFQASVDFTQKDGLQVVGFNKDWGDAAADAFSSIAVDKLFGNFNKQIRKAFSNKGLKGDNLNNAVLTVVKNEADFVESLLKNEIAKKLQDLNKKKDKK